MSYINNGNSLVFWEKTGISICLWFMQKDMAFSALPKGISLGPSLDRAQAEANFLRGKEAVVFAS